MRVCGVNVCVHVCVCVCMFKCVCMGKPEVGFRCHSSGGGLLDYLLLGCLFCMCMWWCVCVYTCLSIKLHMCPGGHACGVQERSKIWTSCCVSNA